MFKKSLKLNYLQNFTKLNLKQINYYTTSFSSDEAFKYCAAIVSKYDKQNYHCSLMLPYQQRKSALAVRAFNIEVASIRDVALRQQTAFARFGFWKDGINSIYNQKEVSNPILIALSQVIKNHAISKSFLQRLIQSREKDFNQLQPLDIATLEKYGEDTASCLLYLTLEICGFKNLDYDHAASHLGKAIGICTVIRATPFHLSQRQCYLPMSLTIKNGFAVEDLFKNEIGDNFSNLIFELACVAKNHLNLSKQMSANSPKLVKKAFLPSIVCEDFLQQLEQVNFDCFNPKLNNRDFYILLKILKKNYFQ
eukprot:TRINITY_DN8596_c0_g1_i1.p1 TRINITY_DN8596_c0_g1~~TRINITY_DN8596_c0_g1_i1.p1  ORF type:complete len:309 (+),score=100.39 TRINITY_DN8596_c0_g1_i1:85-1011(+)